MACDRLPALPDRVLHRVLSFLHARAAARTSFLPAVARPVATGGRHQPRLDVLLGLRRQEGGPSALPRRHGGGLRRWPPHGQETQGPRGQRQPHGWTPSGILCALPRGWTPSSLPRRCSAWRSPVSACTPSSLSPCSYEVPTSRLPCRSLRVLDFTGCTLAQPAGASVFGRLDTLRLHSCKSSPANLQAMLDVAPNLATLWLGGLSFTAEELGRNWYAVMSKRRVLLRCPKSMVAVTLLHCHGTDGPDLDAPNVRFLRYKGFLEHFPFNASTTPSGLPVNLQHVEVSFCTSGCCCNSPSKRNSAPHAMFWESICRFNHLRFLKLKLLDINDIGIHPEQEGMHLKVFLDLKFLELHLKFKVHGDLHAFHQTGKRKAQLDLEKSMGLYSRDSNPKQLLALIMVGEMIWVLQRLKHSLSLAWIVI